MIDKIKKALKRATPGQWTATNEDGWPVGYVDKKRMEVFGTGNGHDDKDWTVWTEPMRGDEINSDAQTDAEYIALVNPKNISELIDRLESAERLLDSASALVPQHYAAHNRKYGRTFQGEMPL